VAQGVSQIPLQVSSLELFNDTLPTEKCHINNVRYSEKLVECDIEGNCCGLIY